MNWDDARVFLAVCRESTLRGAARVLGVDQATVGRRITSLEKSLGATLFLRTSEGYALTAVGEAAMRAIEKMEHSALELERRIQGLDVRFVEAGEADGETDGTRLFAALSAALADVPPDRVAGAIMITDGRVHDIPAEVAALGFNAPVHGLIYELPEEEIGATLPGSLPEAIAALQADAYLAGALGERLVQDYLELKTSEIERNRMWVSDWDFAEYAHHL